jgi:OOP family OmpA-OmpF porin
MKLRPILALSCITGLAILSVGGPSCAREGDYYFGGVSLGQARAKIDAEHVTGDLLNGGLTNADITRDETSTAYKLFVGYQFDRYLGLEIGYFDLGSFGFDANTASSGSLSAKGRLHGVNFDLVGTLPLGERFSTFGRVGAQYADTRDSFSSVSNSLNPNTSKRGFNYKFGGGLQYELTRQITLRGEAERYRINDLVGGHGDVTVVSVGLVFPFERDARPAASRGPGVPDAPSRQLEPTATATPAAALTTTAAAEPPVVIASIAPFLPLPRSLSISDDSLFTFNDSTVRPEAMGALDNFADQLAGTEYDQITLVGHTDRLGTQEYNQTLSMQRAESVKNYLVSSGKLDPAKISVVGVSESDPVTRPEDCQGTTATTQLIACLQADRRVVIEVSGRH